MNQIEIVQIQNPEAKSEVCNQILRSLPLWFGIESAIVDYAEDIKLMETWTVKVDSKVVGFVGINKHNEHTAEVHVMGILQDYHRQGLGKKLLEECEINLGQQGFKYLTVKTLSASRPNKEYDQTREFYLKYGFIPIEEFKTLWGEDNPCLMLIKNLSPALNWTPPVISSERLILRPIVASDVRAIFEYCSDPEVSKHTTWDAHKTIEDSKRLVDYAHSNYRKGMSEPYAIAFKSDPINMIGSVGWFWSSKASKSIEIAYALARPHWGKGIITEACRAAINQAIKENDIHRITSRCIAENLASAKVMEKLGMIYEGTQRQAMLVKGKYVDIKLYAMLRDEW